MLDGQPTVTLSMFKTVIDANMRCVNTCITFRVINGTSGSLFLKSLQSFLSKHLPLFKAEAVSWERPVLDRSDC